MAEPALTIPDDVNSLLDLVKYAWVVGIYWGKQLLGRIRVLEDKQAISPTSKEVEERVDKELSRVIIKLDRMESLLLEVIQRPPRVAPTRTPDIDLG